MAMTHPPHPRVPKPSSSPIPPAPSLSPRQDNPHLLPPPPQRQQCPSLRELARAPHVLSTAAPAQVPHLELLHPGAVPVREPSPLDEELSLWDALQGLGRGYTRVHIRPRQPHHEGGWGLCPPPVQDPLDFALQWGTLWTEEGPQVQGLASGPHPKAPSNRLLCSPSQTAPQ